MRMEQNSFRFVGVKLRYSYFFSRKITINADVLIGMFFWSVVFLRVVEKGILKFGESIAWIRA